MDTAYSTYNPPLQPCIRLVYSPDIGNIMNKITACVYNLVPGV